MADLKWTRHEGYRSMGDTEVSYTSRGSLVGWRIVRDRNTIFWHLYKKEEYRWVFVETLNRLNATELEDRWWSELVGRVVKNV